MPTDEELIKKSLDKFDQFQSTYDIEGYSLRTELKAFIASELSLALSQQREQVEAECKKDIQYYADKYVYDRNQGFMTFVAILQSVLLPKTDARLIGAIVEDVIEEYNKIYTPKTPTTGAITPLDSLK